MNKTIGEWLADEIQKAGVSQAEVARRSGGQRPAVIRSGRIFSGKSSRFRSARFNRFPNEKSRFLARFLTLHCCHA